MSKTRRLGTGLAIALLCVGIGVSTAIAQPSWFHRNTGIRSSDPQLNGPRDMNYDHLLVPGERAGPVVMGGSVADAIQHLGQPDLVDRSTFRGPGYSNDEVYYSFRNECIRFTWEDEGIDPKIERGLRGINVTCDKWQTANGLHVGSTIREVIRHLGEYCDAANKDGSLTVSTKEGIWFEAHDRNSPVSMIRIMPKSSDWFGRCKD